mgnify:CR=1 FL=1
MLFQLHKFPVDWTGKKVTNRTTGEYHNIAKLNGAPYRCFTMDNGYFYEEGLVIKDAHGTPLNVQDYQLIGYNPLITAVNGKVAVSVIVITNPLVPTKLYVDAQMVGGDFTAVSHSIVEAAQGILNRTRPTLWNNITGKPDTWRPTGHFHPLWEWYGFTPFVLQLQRIKEAWATDTDKVLEGLYLGFDINFREVESRLAAIEQTLTSHIEDTRNAHKLTATIMGVGNVPNALRATETQARQANGSILNVFATPWSAKLSLDSNFTLQFNQHVGDLNNPHRVTAAQINSYTREEMTAKALNYLDMNATARRSAMYAGKTLDAWQPIFQNENTTDNFAPGQYPFTLFSKPYLTNVPIRDQVFMANNEWQDIKEVIKRMVKASTKIVALAGNFANSAQALVAIKAAYPNEVDGTLCFYHEQYTTASFNGNGAVIYTNLRSNHVARKVAGVWQA